MGSGAGRATGGSERENESGAVGRPVGRRVESPGRRGYSADAGALEMAEIVRDQNGEAFELRPPQYDDDDSMQLSVRDVLDRLRQVTGVLQNRENREAMLRALVDVGRVDSATSHLEFDEIRAMVQHALDEGMLRLAPHVIDLRPVVDLIDVEPEPLVEDGDEGDEEVEPTHTLEIELRDPDGAPVANAGYSVELPDGEVVRGQLDAQGKAMLSGIQGSGSCKITFTGFDQDAWEAA